MTHSLFDPDPKREHHHPNFSTLLAHHGSYGWTASPEPGAELGDDRFEELVAAEAALSDDEAVAFLCEPP
jgi:hypothetical protein